MQSQSIRNLMAVIFLAAAGLLALRNADALWAAFAFLAASVTVCVSSAGALRGKERTWYAGYAIVCGTYLLLTFTPIVQSRLPTTYLLNGVYAKSLRVLSRDEAFYDKGGREIAVFDVSQS